MLEAGSVRVKNTRNILLKNLLDACAPPLPPTAHTEITRGGEPTLLLTFSSWQARRCVGAFIWWAWGYGTAYHKADGDGNPFIGLPGKAHGSVGWVLGDESASGADFVSWWFQCVRHTPEICPSSFPSQMPQPAGTPPHTYLNPLPFGLRRRVCRHRGHHRLRSNG